MYSKPKHTSDVHDGRPVPGCGACVWDQAVTATLDAVATEAATFIAADVVLAGYVAGGQLDLRTLLRRARERMNWMSAP